MAKVLRRLKPTFCASLSQHNSQLGNVNCAKIKPPYIRRQVVFQGKMSLSKNTFYDVPKGKIPKCLSEENATAPIQGKVNLLRQQVTHQSSTKLHQPTPSPICD